MDKTPAAWGPRASKNVRGTVNCNRDEGTTPRPERTLNARSAFRASLHQGDSDVRLTAPGSRIGTGPGVL